MLDTTTSPADTTAVRPRLARLLVLDGLLTVPMAAAFVVAAGPLERATGIDAGALLVIGAFLLALAAAFIAAGRARRLSIAAACALVAVNVAWVGASVAALAGAWWTLASWGVALVAAQAGVVAVLAIAQSAAGWLDSRTPVPAAAG